MAVVNLNIPLLFSKKKLTEWGATLDFEKDTVHFKSTGETFKLNTTSSGHWTLPLGKSINKEEDQKEVVKKIFMITEKKVFQKRELKKIHRIFGHPTPDKLRQLMADAGTLDNGVLAKLKRIYKECKVCEKYQRRASRPKVGLPKSRNVNEIVSLDLKPVATLLNKPTDKIRYGV